MQPSKQLRGLVESYSDVYGDRDQRNALRAECKSIINCVGVHMVESGFTEQDVKDEIVDLYGEDTLIELLPDAQ